MDPPSNNKPSGVERRSSLRRSPGLSSSAIQSDDEEEYDLAAATVSDGFRPSDQAPTPPPSQSIPPVTLMPASPSQLQSLPGVADNASSKPPQSLPSRSLSTLKPSRSHDSLTLRNNGFSDMGASQSTPSNQTFSSDAPLVRPQSPYRGPTGPSHPYQMYPQSNATPSTAATSARHSYDGPRGPIHPYALYTQNIVPDENEIPQQHIPVGFTGAADSYRRQLGPDGEEAGDLIGPLGHTEELPPYTRYPDESHAGKSSQEANTADASQQLIAGAGGIGVATRNPEFSSTEEDLQPSRSRPSTASRHDINTAARNVAEKPPMNKWQRRAKKKLWGIVPHWAICLLAIGFILMGVIMGAVTGTLLSRHKRPPTEYDAPPESSPTPMPTADVVPLLSVPTDLPPLATGFFALPPLIASQAPKSCFNDTTQSQAWSCDMPFRFYSMKIGSYSRGPATQCYNLSLAATNASDVKFLWGTQPPNIVNPKLLTLVNDTFEQRRGPAWWLKTTYDKTVIISENSFAAKTKRWNYPDPQVVDFEVIQSKSKSAGAKEGDTPWVCTWPDTTLEIFIYPGQNASLSLVSPSTTSTSVPTASTSDSYGGNPYPSDSLRSYRNVVKFLERQSPGDRRKPYCRQVRIVNQGRDMNNVTDSSGKPIEVEILENADSWQERMEQSQRSRHPDMDKRRWYEPFVARETYELTQCGCLWWST